MKIFPRPRIVVSKCLEFDHCRYDGEIIRDELVDRLKECSELLPICPEMEIGLGVPRNPVRIVSTEDGSLRLVQPASEQDVTAKMHAFGAGFIKEIGTVEGYILKSRSPSCGIKDVRVYNPAGRLLHGKGVGLFGQMVLSDLNVAAVEDEGRLRNFRLREHFLITVFSLAAFRIARNAGTIKQLVDYHSANKYLFMAYNQSVLKLMGSIVANHRHLPLEEVLLQYEQQLGRLLQKPPRCTSFINALMHEYGYFSKYLNSQEKEFFLQSLEQFRQWKIPLSVPLHLIKSYVLRFDNEYLRHQTIFEPYPLQLVTISDSGMGRRL